MRQPVYIAAYHQSKFDQLMAMTVPEIVTNAVSGVCQEIKADTSAIGLIAKGHTVRSSRFTVLRERRLPCELRTGN